MIKLTETREITPYKWVHPDEERDCLSMGNDGVNCLPSSSVFLDLDAGQIFVVSFLVRLLRSDRAACLSVNVGAPS
jgi:hypothetical protein